MPQLSCIAIIGKQNNPLYIKNFQPELYEDIKFHYIAHASCDLFNEKALANNRNTNPSSNHSNSLAQYYGLLHIVEDFVIYGYTTNSKIKFIAVLKLGDEVIKDVEMKTLFKKIHAAYVILVCNPFYTFENEIGMPKSKLKISSQFESLIEQLGTNLNLEVGLK